VLPTVVIPGGDAAARLSDVVARDPEEGTQVLVIVAIYDTVGKAP
jgi:F0F1-type ATP synthase membrane subunit c/vacuolar-type H+-ATPase subunit K